MPRVLVEAVVIEVAEGSEVFCESGVCSGCAAGAEEEVAVIDSCYAQVEATCGGAQVVVDVPE